MTGAPLQPLRTTPGNKSTGVTRDQGARAPGSSGETAQPVSVEAFSGLRLRSVPVAAPTVCSHAQRPLTPSQGLSLLEVGVRTADPHNTSSSWNLTKVDGKHWV